MSEPDEFEHPPLERIEDLLTDDEEAELRSDLRRIHDLVHPCWDDR